MAVRDGCECTQCPVRQENTQTILLQHTGHLCREPHRGRHRKNTAYRVPDTVIDAGLQGGGFKQGIQKKDYWICMCQPKMQCTNHRRRALSDVSEIS